MARKHSKGSKKRTHRQKQRGGGWGFTGPSSIPGTPGIVSNPQVFTGIGDCRAVKPGYDISTSDYSVYEKGLPGMYGGKRKATRKGKKSKTRKQRGGRYGFYPEGDPNPNGQLYYAGSYAPVQRIACEGTTQNPLNPTHTGSSAPPGAANPNYYLKGGAQTMAPATYGVGNVDSMYYYAPTASYGNVPSTWVDSVGAPVYLQVPAAGRAMNQACLTTGGHPPLTGALQKGGGIFNGFKRLFGMDASGVDISGVNAGAAVPVNTGAPVTTNSMHKMPMNNNGTGMMPMSQQGGKRRKNRKNKKTRKTNRKH